MLYAVNLVLTEIPPRAVESIETGIIDQPLQTICNYCGKEARLTCASSVVVYAPDRTRC